MTIRRWRWQLEPLYTIAFLLLPLLGMIATMKFALPTLPMVLQILIAVSAAAILGRVVSTVDGLGRFPQDQFHAGVRVTKENASEIRTEHHSIFDLFAVYAVVGIIAGLIFALS